MCENNNHIHCIKHNVDCFNVSLNATKKQWNGGIQA